MSDAMMDPPPALRVKGLTFRRGRDILKGVDWTVGRGQHWALLGPNGCGKTTLINLVTGYDAATSGEIQLGAAVFGRTDWREVRKRVGLVTNTLTTYLQSDEPVIDAVVSGREAKLNLVGERNLEWQREAAELLEQVGCGYLREALWGPLSQGEKQKVLICRALMAQFDVLILDEPCAGLDPVARERFLQWLQALMEQAEAPALVLVTHHVEEILPCIGQVLMLKDGRTLREGDKADVLKSAILSELYGAEVELEYDAQGRYRLRLVEVA